MEFWTAMAVLRRRWYIVAPGLILTVALAVAVVVGVKPVYQATGKMLITQRTSGVAPNQTSTSSTLSPQSTTSVDPADQNPTSQLNPLQFAKLVAEAAGDSTFKDSLVAVGGSPIYEVKPPFADIQTLTLSSSAATPEGAMESYRVLVEAVKEEIENQQLLVGELGVTPYQGSESIKPAQAYPQGGARTKALVLAAAAGLIATLGLTFAFDAFIGSRKRPEPDTQGMVTLISKPRTPLDDLVEIDVPDDLDPPNEPRGSTGNATRW